MSIIPEYKLEDIQAFMKLASDQYEFDISQALPFEEWKCLAYPNLYKNPKRFGVTLMEYGKPIRVSPSGVELLKIIDSHRAELDAIKTEFPPDQQDAQMTELFRRIFVPELEFVIDKPLTLKGVLREHGEDIEVDVPVWFNTTMSQVNIRLGFDNLDASTPGAIPLGDKPVHMLLGGTTGSGKSVAINDIICSLLLEYAPWELSLVLADFKIVELSRYANRIPTPHVKLVAATESTEFALSTFNYLIDEMSARQKVFTACGVQNLKDFRKKFNLCMPRIVLLADEFVQMFENIKVATEKGSENADELKQSIGNAISAVARLGRSQGMHMLLSSQNMDGVLDEQTVGQFGAGASLKATPSVSKALIGNDAGANIRVRGRAYVNLDKSSSVSPNIFVRVPFIESESKIVDGKETKTYLMQLLEDMHHLAKSVGYVSEPYYYNERDTIPKKYLYDALAECIEYMKSPEEGDDIRNELYRENIFARIPLGKELAYTNQLSYPLSIQFKQEHNLLIHADDNITKIAIIRLVGEDLSFFASKFVIATADIALYRQANLEEFTTREKVPVILDTTGKVPEKYFELVQTRKEYMELQNTFTTQSGGCWDDSVALSFVYNKLQTRNSPSLSMITELVADKHADLVNNGVEKFLAENGSNLKEDIFEFVVSVLGRFCSAYKTFQVLTNGMTQRLCSKSFEPIVVWWFGVDNFAGIAERETKLATIDYLSSCCQVGVFNVLVPSLRCDGIGNICESCNFVLERCGKRFFLDANITPRTININENSYQVFDRALRTHSIVRLYS